MSNLLTEQYLAPRRVVAPQPRFSIPEASRGWILAVLVFLQFLFPQSVWAAEALSGKTLSSIQALQDEKSSRSPERRKLDSQLVYALKAREAVAWKAAVPALEPRLSYEEDGRLLVDIRGTITPALVALVNQRGGTVLRALVSARYLRAKVPLDALDAIAALAGVRSIRPADEATTHVGAAESQGNITHAATQVRNQFQIDGGGIKVGVLSDSVDFLTDVQGTGDLPAINILPGQAGIGSGEGTAMLEIIHDLAPGAQLYFASAFDGMESFAQNIRDLAAAGCRIIVDDVGYFRESPFQEDVISQAIADVTAAGTLYFAAAGNSGNKDGGTSGTWEGDFLDGGATSIGRGGRLHDFGGLTYNTMLPGGGARRADLYWSDPLGQSTNDYDLYILDSSGAVVASSTNIQDGNDDPYEAVGRVNVGERVVIVKQKGVSRFLHLATGRGLLTFATGGAVRGHNASPAANAFSVAATWVGASPTEFKAGPLTQVERFSSDGPRRMFYNRDGTPLTPGNFSATGGQVFTKPDLTAADGVDVSTPGFSPFFGTSAAAPHAAAIAALLWSYNPSLSASSLKSALISTALDIGPAGLDSTAGYGVVMPELALAAIDQPLARLTLTSSTLLDANSDGKMQANECGDLYFKLKNLLALAGSKATGVVGTLVSKTPGVLVDPSPRTFGDIAPQDEGTNTVAFRISSDSTLACDRQVELELQVQCANGPSWSFPIHLDTVPTPSGSALVFDATGLPQPIPDLDELDSSILVSGLTKPVAEVVVSLHLTHTYDSDLAMELVGPDGTTVSLAEYVGGSDDNYGVSCSRRTRFTDRASRIIGSLPAPFEGEFQPREALFAFHGKLGAAANGIWQLRIHDDAGLDVGTLMCWSLEIKEVECEQGPGACLVPPSVVQAPTAQTNLIGATAVFSVTAQGTEPLSYQWFRNGDPLVGATSATLTLPGIDQASAASFSVSITNPYGSATTLPVPLVVTLPPVVQSGPVSLTVSSGSPASFQVSVTGTGPFGFQWYHGLNPVIGGTNAVLQIASTSLADAGSYYVTVATPYASTNSPTATLTVIEPPQITLTPTSQVVTNGQPVSFSVTASGSAPLTYFWFFNSTQWIASATGPTLDLGLAGFGDVGSYSVIVSNQAGQVPSLPVSLEVLGSPVFVINPADTNGVRGGVLRLPSFAQGGPAPAYQWFRTDGQSVQLLNQATNALLTVSNLVFLDSGGYFAVASNLLGRATSQVAQVTVLDLPLIVQQPASLKVVSGSPAHFGVQVIGVGPFTYQWFLSRTNAIPGQQSATLDIPVTSLADDGDYSVQISNLIGTVQSESARLTIITTPLITAQPSSKIGPVGGVAEFEVTAIGTTPLDYQWFFNRTNLLAGQTNTMLTLSNLTLGASGTYDVVVANQAGSVTSILAGLTVLVPPSVTIDPFVALAAVDDKITFTSTVLGDGPLTYQWFKNGTTPLPGATDPTLTLSSLQLSDSGQYALQVSNQVGVAVSSNSTLRVLIPPTIDVSPADVLAAEGGTALFAVQASGSPILGYQWFFNSEPIPGAVNSTLLLQNIQFSDQGSYVVQVSNEIGVVFSDKAALEVVEPPAIVVPPVGGVVELNESLHLEVAATGAEPLTYQWFFNTNQPIADAVHPAFDLSKVQLVNSGYYSVTVSNQVGVVSSVPVLVRVLERPEIVQEPLDIAIPRGGRSNLVALVSGGLPISYQWFFNASPVLHATNASLSLVNVTSNSAGAYQLVANNEVGAVTSRVAQVVVKEIPNILQPPVSQTVEVGDSVTFNVIAEGIPSGGALRYQWWFNGIFSLADATNSVFTITGVQPAAAGRYSVEVINDEGSIFSTAALLTVLVAPSFTLQPTDLVVARGSSGASLIADATGTPPITYQWYQNETNSIPDETNSVLVLTSAWTAESAIFSVVAENSLGSVTSRLAQVTVLDPPSFSQPIANRRIPLGGTAQFQAFVSGSAPFDYKWFGPDSNVIPGATGQLLTIPNVQPGDAGNYRVEVSNQVGTNLSSPASLVVVLPPSIIVQPLDQLGAVGGGASFSVVADGTAPLHYQWYFQETNAIPDATNSVLLLTNLKLTDSGAYQCIVSNEAGSVPSKAGELGVLIPPTVSIPPVDQSIITGGLVHFEVKADGSDPLSYQWFFNTNQVIAGAVDAVLEFKVQSGDAGFYSVVISNAVGSVTSFLARLEVIIPVEITTQPTPTLAPTGGAASFAVVVTGSAPITYQWFFNGSIPIVDGTNATLQLMGLNASQSGLYSVVVSNAAGAITSDNALLTVLDPPGFLTPPTSSTAIAGTTASFSSVPTGAPPLAFQWFRSPATPLAGANSSSLSIPNAQSSDAGQYFLVVSNAVGSITSSPVSLTILLAPTLDPLPSQVTIAKGTTLTLPAKAAGSEPLQYQWFYQSTNLVSGATNATLVIPSIDFTNAGPYSLTVSNAAGSVTSPDVNVVVLELPGILSGPLGQLVALGKPAHFEVQTVGAAPLTYFWFFGETNLLSAGPSAFFDIAHVSVADDGFYFVTISNAVGSVTSSPVRLEVILPPVVVVPPKSQTVVLGQSASFAITLTGSSPFQYQWFKDGTMPIPDATNGVLNIPSTTIADGGVYSVVVSNLAGVVTSDGAVLTVLEPISFVKQPTSLTVSNGAVAALSVEVGGSGPISYQWYRDGGELLVGQTSSMLLFDPATSSDAGIYFVQVTNPVGVKASLSAELRVLDLPQFVSQPADVVIATGSTISLTPTVVGSPELRFQWFYNTNQPVANATNLSLSLSPAQPSQSGTYSLVVSNEVGVATSRFISVTVLDPAVIVTQPDVYTVNAGDSVTLTVAATGSELQYRWFLEGAASPIPGATSSSLSFANVSLADAGSYVVVVSNRVSSVTSTPGEIRILVPVEPTSFLYAGDFVTVSFPSIKGLRYTLETTDTLVPPAWVQSPGSIRRKGTGEILTLSDTTTGVPRRYYRLRVE